MLSSPLSLVLALLASVGLASAQSNANCESFGLNVGNGGVYYFNPASQAPFSFASGFANCFGTTTPVLQLPAGSQITCSTINVALSNTESVCPISHAQLLPGVYTIFFPEIGFARGFTVTNTQTTITISQTLTVTGTITPVVTSTSITSSTISSTVTLPPLSITLPAATKGTVTFSPRETVTSTVTRTRTSHVQTTISTTSTVTKKAPCTKLASVKDNPHMPTELPRMKHPRRQRMQARDIAKRDGPDGPQTITTTIFGSPVVVIATASASTTVTILTVDVVNTSTVTPMPFTTFSGTVAISVTLPTKTVTRNVHSTTTSTVTQTRTANFKAIVTGVPEAC